MRGTYSPFIAVSLIVFVAAGVLTLMGPHVMQTTASASPLPGKSGGSCSSCQVKAEAPPIAPVGQPPVADRLEHAVSTKFGATRVDPYYWLNQRDNPKVIAYLEAENAYADAQLNQIALGQPGEVGGRLSANATLTGPPSAPRVAGDPPPPVGAGPRGRRCTG